MKSREEDAGGVAAWDVGNGEGVEDCTEPNGFGAGVADPAGLNRPVEGNGEEDTGSGFFSSGFVEDPVGFENENGDCVGVGTDEEPGGLAENMGFEVGAGAAVPFVAVAPENMEPKGFGGGLDWAVPFAGGCGENIDVKGFVVGGGWNEFEGCGVELLDDWPEFNTESLGGEKAFPNGLVGCGAAMVGAVVAG